jgi:hypothetical protein
VCEAARPSDIILPDGWTWDRVEAERTRWSMGDNMVPVAVEIGVAVAWVTLTAARADQADHAKVEAEADDEEKPAFPFWTVAIYLVDQAYGGPEEGGWYYQCGERQDQVLDGVDPTVLLQVTFDEDLAIRYAEMAQERLDATINAGRRDISSVLSEGRYNALVYNGYPPAHYPETRPHYE